MSKNMLGLASVALALCSTKALAHDMQPGLYQIDVRVELPHLSQAAATKTVRRCISARQIESHTAFRILSDSPLTKCESSPICFGNDGDAGFQVFCPGPAAAYAEARFKLSEQSFTGTIDMKMGGKNMTIVERQSGRRIGNCTAD